MPWMCGLSRLAGRALCAIDSIDAASPRLKLKYWQSFTEARAVGCSSTIWVPMACTAGMSFSIQRSSCAVSICSRLVPGPAASARRKYTAAWRLAPVASRNIQLKPA